MKSDSNKVYFPNLNGLRAIGASIVMIGHIEFLKLFWHMPAFQWFPIPGKIGVALFFALSGFLITSLLLQEIQVTKTIELKNFYVRRILRIWPLYYIIVFFSIAVFNQIGFLKVPLYSDSVFEHLSPGNILILIFLLPNITHFYIPYADQRWSIIVEEQFYLVQPFLIRTFRRRKRLMAVFTVIVFAPDILSFFVKYFKGEEYLSTNIIDAIVVQLKYLACIAVGCLFSFLYFKREGITKKFFFKKSVQIAVVVILLGCIVSGHYIFHSEEMIDYRLYTFLFSIIVLNASQNARTIFKLETRIFNFLGKISYGIYMYHPVCIGASIALSRSVTKDIILQNIVIYFFSIGFTVLVSWLSFEYVESFFLKLKTRFQILRTMEKAESEKVHSTNALLEV